MPEEVTTEASFGDEVPPLSLLVAWEAKDKNGVARDAAGQAKVFKDYVIRTIVKSCPGQDEDAAKAVVEVLSKRRGATATPLPSAAPVNEFSRIMGTSLYG